MLLSKLIRNIEITKVLNFNRDKQIDYVTTNSKLARKNSLFVINFRKNIKKKYITESITNGSTALLTNKQIKNIKIPQFVVKDINSNLNKILNDLYKVKPNNILGITGTNGKTSVMWTTSEILHYNSKKVISLGTLGLYKNMKKTQDFLLTTPEKEDLHKSAYTRTGKNNNEFIFEVSSHAISKQRIRNFPINIAAITNITQDHLDFHKSIKNYKNTKLKLFSNFLIKNGTAIINDRIPNLKNFIKKLDEKNIKIISYGKKNSDICCSVITNKKIEVKIYNKKYIKNYQIISYFDLENLACSIACAIALGLTNNEIIRAIKKLSRPKGRMEFVDKLKNNSEVYIDYAHTPDALLNILKLNMFKRKKPDLVFGCGGDRDKSKRKIMGQIANKFANKIYITDDNPRYEDPKSIRKMLLSICKKAQEIPNRKIAIKKAIENLDTNTTLIIAGKGHEKKQIYKNKILDFDDYKVAKNYINKKNK
tara:strand:- start:314 stop:1753 length:1440 start_codon:yes stop_codon:yes gene_type:complete